MKLARTICFLALLAACISPMQAAAKPFGDVVVQAVSQSLEHWTHGYLEHRLRVSNLSAAHARRVRIVMPAQSYGYGGGERIEHLERTVVLSPGASAVVSIATPPLPCYGNDLANVFVDGRLRGVVHVPTLRNSLNNRDGISLITSRGINRDTLHNQIMARVYPELKVQKRRRYYSHNPPYFLMRSESETDDWSTSWLAYTPFDGILVTGQELASMPAAVRAALWRYTASGGVLAIEGTCAIPEPWASRRGNAGKLTHYQVGLGIAIMSGEAFATSGRHELKYILDQCRTTRSAWALAPTRAKAQKGFPVVKDLRVPVRGIFLIMLAFAILLGPVSLIVLGRFQRRIWLLWIAPALALLTSGILFLYSLLAEGVTPTIRTTGFTILNQVTREATTLGVMGVYAPLTPADGLHFEYDTEVTPLGTTDRQSAGGSGRTVNWTRDQHMTRGWVTARIPSHFRLRKSEPRRERMEIRETNTGTIEAMNGLGVDIEKLWLADANGRIHISPDGIPSGRSLELRPLASAKAASTPQSMRKTIYNKGNWPAAFLKLTENEHPPQILRAGTYVAMLSANPFIEEGLRGKAKRLEQSIVYGIYAGEIADAGTR